MRVLIQHTSMVIYQRHSYIHVRLAYNTTYVDVWCSRVINFLSPTKKCMKIQCYLQVFLFVFRFANNPWIINRRDADEKKSNVYSGVWGCRFFSIRWPIILHPDYWAFPFSSFVKATEHRWTQLIYIYIHIYVCVCGGFISAGVCANIIRKTLRYIKRVE